MNTIKNYALVVIIAVAAFFVGNFIGQRGLDKSGMSAEACVSLQSSINSSAKNTLYGKDNIEKLKELNDIFAKNCRRGKFESKPASTENGNAAPLPSKTCAAIETLLLEKIGDKYDERSKEGRDSMEKANIYTTLYEKGCAENREKHRALAVREIEIGLALFEEPNYEAAFIYKRLGMMSEASRVLSEMKKAGMPEDEIRDLEKRLRE